MPELEFEPLSNALISPGLVLRIQGEVTKYLRVTHVFDTSIYGIWINTPEKARYARRPVRISLKLLKGMEKDGAEWGRVVLPPEFTVVGIDPDGETEQELEAASGMVMPIIELFEKEKNLSRTTYTASIRQRAEALQVSFITLFRLVIRYYYFGRTRRALLPLSSGVKAGTSTYCKPMEELAKFEKPYKRRGPKSILEGEFGVNEFVVMSEDIDDMVRCLKYCLSKGATNKTAAHEIYLKKYFSKRHTEIYQQYLAKNYPEPVTKRQFTHYVDMHARLSDELAANLRKYNTNPGSLGSIRASGPGEVYEIDATGGRIHLVASNNPTLVLGKPIIYLIIDRWSRFIVSVYISLRPASWEELRYALLIAFTSRERRFNALGIDIDNTRWPIGRFPAVLCPDRGSDFLGESAEQAITQDLRIELTPLPPFCPDGKAIVERVIREIKRRMASSSLTGTYADRPMDPKTKRIAKKAAAAATHSLKDAYRAVIEIIIDHNNRPHSALKKKGVLTRAGVPPVPREAYLWGLENITGLRTPPLTEDDYRKMLLSVDEASISKGVIRYKGRPYMPANEAAIDLARNSTARSKRLSVRLDKTDPFEIFVEMNAKVWASFEMTSGAINDLGGLTLDEEEALEGQSSWHWARAQHNARIARVSTGEVKKQKVGKVNAVAGQPTELNQNQIRALRQAETAELKEGITQRANNRKVIEQEASSSSTPDWKKIEEEAYRKRLKTIRQNRGKK